MAIRTLTTKDRSSLRLFLVFGAVVGSFLVTNVIIQTFSAQIGSLSDTLVFNSSPSIERLASLRGTTLEVELLLSRYLQEGRSDSSLAQTLHASLEKLNQDVQAYLSLPTFPGEQEHWARLQRSWIGFDQAVRTTRELADAGDELNARAMFLRSVAPQGSGIVDAALQSIEFNAKHGRAIASRIKDTRERTMWLLNGLTALSVLLGAAGAALIDRHARSRRALVEAHSRFLEDRAAELEQFAGRVAHDIRNPLAGATMAAQLLERVESDERTQQLGHRIVRSLARASAITSGLLEFARAGARPDPGARTSPREVLADMTAALTQEAAEANIQIHFEPVPPVLVACSEGVYLSLVGNLVRNAIKYMGEGPTRRITVRIIEEPGQARTEVVDTGPGIPEQSLPALFEPYFRAGTQRQDGLGLGLATVKKHAEGHGGRAGVNSVVGSGSTFWFTLPSAGRPDLTNVAGAASESRASLPAHARH
jgi:signal transduction histidine kinase